MLRVRYLYFESEFVIVCYYENMYMEDRPGFTEFIMEHIDFENVSFNI